MIIVANKRKPIYAGPVPFDPPFIYIGRPSPLGNPFVIGLDGTRDEVVDKYEVWLRGQYLVNSKVKKAIDGLVLLDLNEGDLTLTCWCAPARCHGDVIKKFVEELCKKTF